MMPLVQATRHREENLKNSDTYDGIGRGLPRSVCAYVAHVSGGLSLRKVAELTDCYPSTVMRQVRRVELRRDDELYDEALEVAAGAMCRMRPQGTTAKDWKFMLERAIDQDTACDEEVVREARRILRRLCEKDSFLAVASDMENAVVIRETVPGRHTRTAVVKRSVAQKFALNDWIECVVHARISRYGISNAGRSALKRMLEEDRQRKARKSGFSERVTPFQAQHQEPGERSAPNTSGPGSQRVRVNLAESPLTILGRKLDRSGKPYLTGDLVEAGERLREDFEVAQMGPRVTQNWDNFLAHGDMSQKPTSGGGTGPEAARDRVTAALGALGPGLSDVAFRVCCFLEGLETAEKRLGWSARSGKVVLRIALQRLAEHYGIAPSAADQPQKKEA